jgi:putative ABC transport system substrate-binding protein
MRRRELLIALGGGVAVVWPIAARAQQKAMPVVGLLGVSRDSTGFLPPFRKGLGEAGYIEGQNVTFEHVVADFQYDRMPALAADLVGRRVDVIVTINGTPWALAAKGVTSTIPIIFTGVGDPIGIGLVASLGHPGGNLTGFTNIATELISKQIELISELVPGASRIALLVNPKNENAKLISRDVQEVTRARGVKLSVFNASTEGEIDAAFASLAEVHPDALAVDPDGFFTNKRKQIAALASQNGLPAIYAHPECVAAGGLISYGIDDEPVSRQAGVYTARILKGEKPTDLPVQQPTKFQLIVNLKTAKALGLTVPQSILARADEVIE